MLTVSTHVQRLPLDRCIGSMKHVCGACRDETNVYPVIKMLHRIQV